MIEILLSFLLLINAERTTPLVPDEVLTVRAFVRAETLCIRNEWSHEGWIQSFAGLQYHFAGENLAKGFSTQEETHKALMGSPTHKANILNPLYKKVGVAQGSCGIYAFLFSD